MGRCEIGLGRSTGPGEMVSFGETSEQECDKDNSSPPTASRRGTNTETTPVRRKEKKRSLHAGDAQGDATNLRYGARMQKQH